MKPKSTLRLFVIVFVAVASAYFLENTRQTHNLNYKSFSPSYSDDEKLSVSNNDFIFFESISKYLLVSFTK
jgi:hypothetical protein